MAREIGLLIKGALDEKHGPKRVGFALLLFDFGKGGNMTYVSSAERQDMIAAIEECLTVLKSGKDEPPIPPKGKRH